VVIADAGNGAGLGHVSRAGAVAAALTRLGVAPRCLALGAEGAFERDGMRWEPLASLASAGLAPVVVLDSYVAPQDAVSALAQQVKLVLVHDRGGVPKRAALVIDGDASALRDACLRPQYWDVPKRRHRAHVERVLVTTGGGDPGGAGTRLALAAKEALPAATVALVRGPYANPETPPGVETVAAPDSLLDELLRADIAVSGAGQTMLEACAAGTPCVAVALAEDQRHQGARAGKLDAVVFAAEERVPSALKALAGVEVRRELGERAQELVDGRGALRVARRIADLVNA
jgi:spore coat polysaccharide biosynthesis predicted glycosyltransferase SpsG